MHYTFRVKSYIDNGWDKHIIDPDSTQQQQSSATATSGDLTLGQNWQDIKNYATVIKFTNAQIIEYFVLRTAIDGLPVSDFTEVNEYVST